MDLGSGEFVEQIIKEAEGIVRYQLLTKEHHPKQMKISPGYERIKGYL